MSETLDPVERARSSDEYKIAKEQIADREWRIDNLYWVKDEDGSEVQFKRRYAQQKFYDEQWYRDAIVKARQLGFRRSASFCASQ